MTVEVFNVLTQHLSGKDSKVLLHKQSEGLRTLDMKSSAESYTDGVKTAHKRVQPPKTSCEGVDGTERYMVSQAIQRATRRTEFLAEAIEHYFCTPYHLKEVKLNILSEAESNMVRVKQTAAKGRYKLAELKVLAIHLVGYGGR